MRLAASFFLLFLLADAGPPEAAVPYFSNVRGVQIAQPDRQNYFIVDAEIWGHARPDLGDLRLYDGETPVQFAISEQRAGISSEEVEAKILNLGSVAGHTEFDLDTGGLPEYDRIRLRLDAHDFVTTASISGGAAPGKATEVELPASTLYDFTKEQLGANSQLKVPTSSFRYLHVKLSAGVRPAQVKGATIYNLHEQKAAWTKVGACAAPEQKQRKTLIACTVPAKVPVNRVTLQIAPEQVNFRRSVSVEDAKGQQIAAGEISRVRMNRGGIVVTNENLGVSVESFAVNNEGQFTIVIDNGDNPPLKVLAADPLAIERRIYFDPHGKSALTLYYGDEKLAPPVYDYARFFHQETASSEAQLGAGTHNAQYTGRPDDRPWSEQHKVILWGAMLLAVLVLAILALRGFRAAPQP